MKGKTITIVASIMSIVCLSYYSIRYCIEKQLVFASGDMGWFALTIGMLIVLLLKLICVENKLEKVMKMLEDLRNSQIQNHHNSVKMEKTTRRLILGELIKDEEKGE